MALARSFQGESQRRPSWTLRRFRYAGEGGARQSPLWAIEARFKRVRGAARRLLAQRDLVECWVTLAAVMQPCSSRAAGYLCLGDSGWAGGAIVMDGSVCSAAPNAAVGDRGVGRGSGRGGRSSKGSRRLCSRAGRARRCAGLVWGCGSPVSPWASSTSVRDRSSSTSCRASGRPVVLWMSLARAVDPFEVCVERMRELLGGGCRRKAR